jgi:indolepyruvate ferredoxin oxidoreductase alpha subunit
MAHCERTGVTSIPRPPRKVPAEAPVDVAATVAATVHPRPPSFCTGCPERPIFTAMKLLERELGKHHVSCDIGCNLFSILPPFEIGATTMGYGLGWAGAAALNTQETSKRTISVMGDGGFWHNGLASGIGNAVFNKADGVIVNKLRAGAKRRRKFGEPLNAAKFEREISFSLR